MGSLGSPDATWFTPKKPKKDLCFYQRPFSSTKKQGSRPEGGSCSRKLSGAGSPGRFIPRRFSMDMEAANFCLQSPCTGSTDWSNEVFEDAQTWGSLSARQHRHRMARLSQGASERKILNFGSESMLEEKLRRCSERFSADQVELTFSKPARKLPKYPEHVLDLPKLQDDFYTHAMCWSADDHLVAGLGNRLYTCSLQGEGTTLLQDLCDTKIYVSVSCNSKGNLLAATTNYGETQIWDLNTFKLATTIFHNHNLDLNYDGTPQCKLVGLDWSPNADVIATGCGNGVIEVVDLRRTPNHMMTKWEPACCISGLKFSPNGAYLAASTSWHKIIVWDITNIQKPTEIFSEHAHASAIRALSWYPFKNTILASGGGIDDGFIRLWNVHTGQKLTEITVKAQVCNVLWSPVTKELLTSQSVYDKHSVVVWEYPGLNKVGSLAGHTGRVLHMALSPDQSQLATAAADETLRIWNLKTSARGGSGSSTRSSHQTLLLQGLR